MDDTTPEQSAARRRERRLLVRGVLWGVLLVVWTAALLTPYPVQVGDAVLPEKAHFPAAKLLHISAYAVLAALCGALRPLGRYRWLLLAFLSFHAAATEFLQQYVPLRGPSVRDVVLDHVGILLGLVLAWPWWRKPS